MTKSRGIYRKRGSHSDTCTVEGCNRPYATIGFCVTHAKRFWRNGNIGEAIIPERNSPGTGSINSQGYKVFMKDGVFYSEHRMVMEAKLGRKLLPGENVHHINGDKLDNRPENLELWIIRQPPGQRLEDIIEYSKEILRTYEPSALVAK